MNERIGLFIPCFIDQCAPQIGRAVLRVLERVGVSCEYPESQTCCGQPWYNGGCHAEAATLLSRWDEIFAGFDLVVCPSASCVSMVRNHAAHLGVTRQQPVPRIYEICEFLHDVVQVRSWEGTFPHRVGVHIGCHGLRELGLARPSERVIPAQDKVSALLGMLRDITLVRPQRDECCGFGGTFAVTEPKMSVAMGRDRLADHEQAGAELIASTDWSCVMHLEGIARREGRRIRFCHVAEILAPEPAP